MTLLVLLACALVLSRGLPRLDHTPEPLRPRHSPAYATLEEIKQRMNRARDPLWLIVAGRDEQEVAGRLTASRAVLARALSEKRIAHFTLPDRIWPNPEFQNANRPALQTLLAEEPRLRQLARTHGFNPDALRLTEMAFATWRAAAAAPSVFWPTNTVSHWIFEKFTARTPDQLLALGMVHPTVEVPAPENGPTAERRGLRPGSSGSSWAAELPRQHVWLAGWDQLGLAILEVVQRDLWRVLVPMICLLLGALWFAFGRLREVLICLASLAFTGLCLLTVMRAAGWSWNLLNLTALPLLLGAGVDYPLHMLLALRRHKGDIPTTRRVIGRALFLCAATTVAAFGSLGWSSNAGLASLGKVCAAGIALAFLTSTLFLPAWWQATGREPNQ